MITPSGRIVGAVSLVLLVIGAVTGWTTSIAIGAAGFVALAAAGAYLLARPDLDVDRQLVPGRVTVGGEATGRLHIRNDHQQTSASLTAYEQVAGNLVEVAIPRLAGGATTSIDYSLPTARRGVVTVGPLLLRRADPLGLLRADRAYGGTDLLWVHPRRHVVPPLPSQLLRSLEGPTSDSSPQGTLTFHSLREYVRGDDLRHIHWRSSARTGTLMVRRLIDTSLPDVTVVLDLTRTVWDEASFEQAIEVAASILCACARAQFPARLVYSDGTLHQPNDGPIEQRFLDHLTEVALQDLDVLATTIDRLATEGQGTAAVIITGDTDDVRLARLSRLGRRYERVVAVAVRPERSSALAVSGVTSIDVSTSTEFTLAWSTATPTRVGA